jgi:gamma-butyrobetaine dioxygenase
VDLIEELFESEGMREYLGEPVTLIQHMLQAATLAQADGAPDAMIAAALLHDVGHVRAIARDARPEATQEVTRVATPRATRELTRDAMLDRHADGGADWLAHWFPPSVTEPVRLHVAAKRYLCAVEADYAARLSEASTRSLAAQGGPMSAAEVEEFEASPYASAAVAVRRWDEAAKDPDARTLPFAHFRPVLEALAG